MRETKKTVLWVAPVCALALTAGLVACAPQQRTSLDGSADQAAEIPAADEFGVIEAESWQATYPHQYETYLQNGDNAPGEEKHDYLELYPALKTLYAGYGGGR